jgi:hypothetical protein
VMASLSGVFERPRHLVGAIIAISKISLLVLCLSANLFVHLYASRTSMSTDIRYHVSVMAGSSNSESSPFQ